MKKKNLIRLLMIAVFLAAFACYKQYDALKTDNAAPVISFDDSQLLEISVKDPKSALLQGVTAKDERDGDVSGKLVVENMQLVDTSGLIEVGYAVTDNSGNVAKTVRKVQYTDYQSPKFGLRKALIYEVGDDFDIMADAYATDVIDGDIQHRIRTTAVTGGTITKEGLHKVHFQVTNSLGDMMEIIVPVEVLERGYYPAELELTDYMIYLPLNSVFMPKNYLGSFTHKLETIEMDGKLPRDFVLETAGSVDTGIPGVYTVEYRVTRIVRHETNPDFDQEFTGYSRLIVVVEG